MNRRYSYKQFSSLWSKDQVQREAVPLTYSSEKAFIKKAMDEVCLSAELAEKTSDYTYILCKGMKRLFSIGATPKDVETHRNLLNKILYLGKDILESSQKFSELFYLGVLIEMKMVSKWREVGFYTFLISALKSIKKESRFISKEMKIKLTKLFAKDNTDLYRYYFS
jgi:hypothetical protein